MYLLSEICVNGSDTTSMECVLTSYDARTWILRYIVGTWLAVVSLVGIFGNLITLLSIPFAAKRKLHGLHRNFRSTAVFILHLSFIELCWCLMSALPMSYQLLGLQWKLGTVLCKATAMTLQVFSCTESVALAVISISRCLDTIKSITWRTLL